MRIEYDIKLGFKDVMFRPKRSTLSSRSQVKLERTFRLKHSNAEWTGIPVMAANMDTVGTFEMALALFEKKLFTPKLNAAVLENACASPVQPSRSSRCGQSVGTSKKFPFWPH